MQVQLVTFDMAWLRLHQTFLGTRRWLGWHYASHWSPGRHKCVSLPIFFTIIRKLRRYLSNPKCQKASKIISRVFSPFFMPLMYEFHRLSYRMFERNSLTLYVLDRKIEISLQSRKARKGIRVIFHRDYFLIFLPNLAEKAGGAVGRGQGERPLLRTGAISRAIKQNKCLRVRSWRRDERRNASSPSRCHPCVQAATVAAGRTWLSEKILWYDPIAFKSVLPTSTHLQT